MNVGDSNDITSDKSPKANTVKFLCSFCGDVFISNVSEIGKYKECRKCGTENEVPLPKLRVGGGRSTGSRHKGKSREAGDIFAPSQKSTEKNHKPQTTSDAPSELTRSATPFEFGQLVSAVALLFFAAVIGWGIVNFGPQVIQRLTSQAPTDVPDISTASPSPQQVEPEQIQNLLRLCKEAKLATNAVETDLKVTLAEMEARNMDDQADIVRSAIDKKLAIIGESRSRYASTMANLALNYSAEPTALRDIFQTHASSPSVQSSPAANAFLQKTITALKGLPAEKNSHAKYFEQVFESLRKGVDSEGG